jgi:biopolymer transport protein ExbD
MQSLEIIVSKDLQISVDDEILVLSSLTSTLNARFEQAENKDLFSLLIKVDGHLPVEKLQPVLSAIKQTGIKRVSLATQRLAETA